jgi:hypothetical protein
MIPRLALAPALLQSLAYLVLPLLKILRPIILENLQEQDLSYLPLLFLFWWLFLLSLS